jgi:hypothetical protein
MSNKEVLPYPSKTVTITVEDFALVGQFNEEKIKFLSSDFS